MSGDSQDIYDDEAILKINSPKNNVGGPYIVVFKNVDDLWAIVAMDWDGSPRLGMRWFTGNGGNPFSSSYPIWLVVPPSLSKSILAGLPLEHKINVMIDDFLAEKIDGPKLKNLFANKNQKLKKCLYNEEPSQFV